MIRPALLCCLLTLAAGHAQTVLLDDSFTKETYAGWAASADDTATTATVVEPGQLSPTCLEVRKLDYCGLWRCHRRLAVTAGHYLRLTADLRALRVGPFAEYFLMVRSSYADTKT